MRKLVTIRPLVVVLALVCSLAGPAESGQVRERPSADHPTAFAIFVDSKTHAAAAGSLRAYRAAVEADGLATWLIADDWKSPDAVRAVISELRKADPPIEGAVFVGRIPVPMIRDAQHLTSAFKMDQERYPRRRSSVPSDRFYEDLDLRFTPLGADEDEPLLHYYSLAANSPQRVEKEIYSGRILFGAEPDPERLRAYLAKVVRRKRQRRPLADAMVVTGHGYNSGSTLAWAEQGWLLREQMPWLYRPGGRVRRYFHSDHRDLKERVLEAIREPGLNLAVFHAHGRPDTQYLLGLPPTTTAPARVEALKRDLRNRLRRVRDRGGDVEEARAALMERFDVPASWLVGALDPEVEREDEAADLRLDIRVDDLRAVASSPEVVVLDECFNGRFIENECIAGEYVFGPGGTVAAIANSVNVLQDVWADEGLGLIGHGLRIGEVHRRRPHLESHVIGDPTFRFAERSCPSAARHALDLLRLHRRGAVSPETLREHLLGDPSETIRLTALKLLARDRGEVLGESLIDAVRDPGEMVRRQAVRLMGDRTDPAYVAPLLGAFAFDPSRRVAFQAQTALQRFDTRTILNAIDAWNAPEAVKHRLWNRFGGPNRFLDRELVTATDPSADPERRVRAIRTFRLYRVEAAIPGLLAVARSKMAPASVRRAAVEALGWFVQSRRRAGILTALEALEALAGKVPPVVSTEAEKSRRRLEAGPNDPFAP